MEWAQIQRLQILMFARMIRSKPSVPHQIIQVEFNASPLQLDTAFHVITLGLNIDRLPPFQYSLDTASSYTSPTNQKINQIIQEDLLQLHTFKAWLLPPQAAHEARFLPPTLPPYLTGGLH